MSRNRVLTHEFVEHIPEVLQPGRIYVSVTYATAVHKCCCGCGHEVVTPLSPTDWTLIFDGRTVSLDPSIGNWSFPCQSHYWIRRNTVKWAPRWSADQVAANRAYDLKNKRQYFEDDTTPMESAMRSTNRRAGRDETIWKRLRRWLTGL